MTKKFASQADLTEKVVSFDRLSENAYAYTAQGDPNTGIVIGDDSVMVIDTQATPVMAQDVIRRIREVTDKPIKYVVMSHYHAVRVLGAVAYGASEIIASRDTYDLIVERGTSMIYCAGAIAKAYEDLGGTALYAGKPHAPIYHEAKKVAEGLCGHPIDISNIFAIGDAFMTDVAGALAFGVECVLIARGIHSEDFGLHQGPLSPQAVAKVMQDRSERPLAVMDVLA